MYHSLHLLMDNSSFI